jgi:hypothetical protein
MPPKCKNHKTTKNSDMPPKCKNHKWAGYEGVSTHLLCKNCGRRRGLKVAAVEYLENRSRRGLKMFENIGERMGPNCVLREAVKEAGLGEFRKLKKQEKKEKIKKACNFYKKSAACDSGILNHNHTSPPLDINTNTFVLPVEFKQLKGFCKYCGMFRLLTR